MEFQDFESSRSGITDFCHQLNHQASLNQRDSYNRRVNTSQSSGKSADAPLLPKNLLLRDASVKNSSSEAPPILFSATITKAGGDF